MNSTLAQIISVAAIALPMAVVATFMYCSFRLIRFQRSVPTLMNSSDIDRYKHEARINMYAQVISNVLLIGGGFAVIGASILVRWYFLLVVPAFGLVLVGLTNRFVHLEEWALTMPAANEKLAHERDRIAEIWQNERFPNW